MKIAMVPGSFDPITKGHIDLIERASKTFDLVLAVCMINENKQYMFTIEQRENMLIAATKHLKNVQCDSYDGWLYDYVINNDISAIVKGIRNERDLVYETEHALFNKEHSGVDTLFLLSDERYKDVSSTRLREMIANNEDLSGLTSSAVARLIKKYTGGDNHE